MAIVILRPLGLLRRLARGLDPEGEAEVAFRPDQSLRHLLEGLGLPSCEIGAARIGEEGLSLELPPPDGSAVELVPIPEPVDPGSAPRFVADVHLGRLARDLRLLGFDVLWRNDLGDPEIVALAAGERRITLTRDRGLLLRRPFAGGGPRDCLPAMLVRSRDPYEQLLDAFARFDLSRYAKPFSLCSSCGGELAAVSPETAAALVPARIAERYSEFFRCPACGKVFWRGDHFRTIAPFLERLNRDVRR